VSRGDEKCIKNSPMRRGDKTPSVHSAAASLSVGMTTVHIVNIYEINVDIGEHTLYKYGMADETAIKMYESARERLKELLRQEIEIKDQITHWGPIVEQLARLTGETLDHDIANRINELKQDHESAQGAGQEMGLTEAIRWVFRQPLLLPLTPTQVRDRMADMGYDLSKYKHVMPPIHNTLKRMKEAGEIREVDGFGGIGRAYESARRGT
jgi:hypothetical protein